MKAMLILLAGLLAGCTVPLKSTTTATAPTVTAPVQATAPAVQTANPEVKPDSAPVRLVVADTKLVTVTLKNDVLNIKLTDDAVGAWVRLLLPSGDVSPVTQTVGKPYLGLGGNSAHEVAVNFLAGLRVETGQTPDGPWSLVAETK